MYVYILSYFVNKLEIWWLYLSPIENSYLIWMTNHVHLILIIVWYMLLNVTLFCFMLVYFSTIILISIGRIFFINRFGVTTCGQTDQEPVKLSKVSKVSKVRWWTFMEGFDTRDFPPSDLRCRELHQLILCFIFGTLFFGWFCVTFRTYKSMH